MLHNFTRRRWLVIMLGTLSLVVLVLVGRRLNATKIGGQQPAEPFRIAGNFYYVGASDVVDLSHYRARGSRRPRRRLSHYCTDDHGEHREARLRHQGCESALEFGAASRPCGRPDRAAARLRCQVVGESMPARTPLPPVATIDRADMTSGTDALQCHREIG